MIRGPHPGCADWWRIASASPISLWACVLTDAKLRLNQTCVRLRVEE